MSIDEEVAQAKQRLVEEIRKDENNLARVLLQDYLNKHPTVNITAHVSVLTDLYSYMSNNGFSAHATGAAIQGELGKRRGE